MKISEDQLKEGRKLAKQFGFKELYVNEKGEFFTNKSYASMSVGYDKEKFVEVSLTETGEGKPEKEEKATNDLGKAVDVIAAIEAATVFEIVKAILKAETEGKNRPSVVKAAQKKLEELGSKVANETKDSKEDKDSEDTGDTKDSEEDKEQDDETLTNKAE